MKAPHAKPHPDADRHAKQPAPQPVEAVKPGLVVITKSNPGGRQYLAENGAWVVQPDDARKFDDLEKAEQEIRNQRAAGRIRQEDEGVTVVAA